jgi:hypothetical protein
MIQRITHQKHKSTVFLSGTDERFLMDDPGENQGVTKPPFIHEYIIDISGKNILDRGEGLLYSETNWSVLNKERYEEILPLYFISVYHNRAFGS